MAEIILWCVAALVVVAAAMRLSGRGRAVAHEPEERIVLRDMHPHHCVAITPCADACAAARRLQGLRFLANEAPRLPLPRCSSLNCSCVYAHFDDRRHHARRDPYLHPALEMSRVQEERRVSPGRRKTDGLYHPVN